MIVSTAIANTCCGIAVAAVTASCLVFGPLTPVPSSFADTGLVVIGTITTVTTLAPCPADHNCVSSNYREPPNRYVSPLKLVNDRDKAFQRAVKDLNSAAAAAAGDATSRSISIAEIKPEQYYIHLTVPGTAPGSLDDLELLFVQDNSNNNKNGGSGIVNVRCDARVTLPVPPFCVKKNCINGNMDQRRRVETAALLLNLPPSDQQQMQSPQTKWTPIFFNSDRVPGFYDDDDDY